MQQYEYKVVPAPSRGIKQRGAKTPSDRFAAAVAEAMNALAREGWEYVRADMLPSEERSGLSRKTTVYNHLLVFRRPVSAERTDAPPPAAAPRLLSLPRLRLGAGKAAETRKIDALPLPGNAPPVGPAHGNGHGHGHGYGHEGATGDQGATGAGDSRRDAHLGDASD